MISTPTPPWPRPFHLWSRPQLDFLRITRIRKSYGMVFLHQNIWMHTPGMEISCHITISKSKMKPMESWKDARNVAESIRF